jgi:hypothetical protein
MSEKESINILNRKALNLKEDIEEPTKQINK